MALALCITFCEFKFQYFKVGSFKHNSGTSTTTTYFDYNFQTTKISRSGLFTMGPSFDRASADIFFEKLDLWKKSYAFFRTKHNFAEANNTPFWRLTFEPEGFWKIFFWDQLWIPPQRLIQQRNYQISSRKCVKLAGSSKHNFLKISNCLLSQQRNIVTEFLMTPHGADNYAAYFQADKELLFMLHHVFFLLAEANNTP